MRLWDLLEVVCVKTMLKFDEKNPSGSASLGGKTVLIFSHANPLGLSHFLGVFYGFSWVFHGFIGYSMGF